MFITSELGTVQMTRKCKSTHLWKAITEIKTKWVSKVHEYKK